jgi:hypothetical protein
VDRAERLVVAHPEERDQLVVGAETQQRTVCYATEARRRMEC